MLKQILKLSEDEYRQHCRDYDGFCFKCREWTDGEVEPDARKYLCPNCRAPEVYGAEELSLMEVIEFTD